jgi:hypothetical protein
MEFTEEVAQQTIEKFGLDPKTFLVWKTRNKIPDRYFKDDYKHRDKEGQSDKIDELKMERLIKTLDNQKIMATQICKLANLKQTWLIKELSRSSDRREERKVFLSETEYQNIVNEIKRMRIEIKDILDGVSSGSEMGVIRKKKLIKFLVSDPRIWRQPIVGEKIAKRISEYRKSNDLYLKFSPNEYDEIYNQMAILIFELTV